MIIRVEKLIKFLWCLIFILMSFTKQTRSDSDSALAEVFDEIADIRVTQKVIVDQVNSMKDTMRSLEQIHMEFDSLISLSYDIEELKQAIINIEGKLEDGSKDTNKPTTSELTEVQRLREEILLLKDDLRKCRLELIQGGVPGCAKDEDTRYGSGPESSKDSCKGRQNKEN